MKLLRVWIACLALLAPLAFAAPPPFENRLADHPSPYLAMHGHDPVRWQPWGAEAVDLARKLNRPLFISSGYFSCHWCHVMQRESYQDPLVAKILNTWFVPVKVDRELDPALDAHLIEFVELTRGRAGWPLNVFLTPEGYPIVGFTYLKREAFVALLNQVRDRWRDEPDELRRVAAAALEEWRAMRDPGDPPQAPRVPMAPKLVEQASRLMDEMDGGFGQQNKFPMVPQLRALIRARGKLDDSARLDDFLRLTLDRMASQGLHDLLGGGFFRYTVDPGWRTPHYEKMLYDNAQMVSLYLQAAAAFNAPRYRVTALETLDFMLRDMWRGDHFIASFSAVDAQGREGAYYLWNDEELKKLLTPEQLKLARLAWFDDAPPESPLGRLPRWRADLDTLATRSGVPPRTLRDTLETARKRLEQARRARSLPADHKGLAAWNGLALSALADAAISGQGRRYREPGARLAAWLATRLWDGEKLVRARDGERALAEGSLEDYALVAKGLSDWGHATGDRAAMKLAATLVRQAWKRFYRNGRWMEADKPLIPMLDGKLALDDGHLPSASAVAVAVARTLEGVRGDKRLAGQVDAHLDEVRARLTDSIFWYASYVEWLDRQLALAVPHAGAVGE